MTTSLQDLLAQQAELAAAIAARTKPLLQEAQALLTSEDVEGLKASLTTIRDQLPDGQAKTQIGNVITVLTAVAQVLAHEIPPDAPATPVVMPIPSVGGGE
jgi:hypothetical protein